MKGKKKDGEEVGDMLCEVLKANVSLLNSLSQMEESQG